MGSLSVIASALAWSLRWRRCRRRKFSCTACKIDEILVQLLEREAEREDALHRVAGQILRQSIAARIGDFGGIGT